MGSGEALPRGWKRVFQVEVIICVATAAFWFVAPDAYARALFVAPVVSPLSRYLTLQAAGILLCAWGYLYARLLHGRSFSVSAFCRLQEAMAIGDVIVLWSSFSSRNVLSFERQAFVAQIAMAAVWLAIRVGYLASSGWRTEAALQRA